jgi:hypothetical protein
MSFGKRGGELIQTGIFEKELFISPDTAENPLLGLREGDDGVIDLLNWSKKVSADRGIQIQLSLLGGTLGHSFRVLPNHPSMEKCFSNPTKAIAELKAFAKKFLSVQLSPAEWINIFIDANIFSPKDLSLIGTILTKNATLEQVLALLPKGVIEPNEENQRKLLQIFIAYSRSVNVDPVLHFGDTNYQTSTDIPGVKKGQHFGLVYNPFTEWNPPPEESLAEEATSSSQQPLDEPMLLPEEGPRPPSEEPLAEEATSSSQQPLDEPMLPSEEGPRPPPPPNHWAIITISENGSPKTIKSVQENWLWQLQISKTLEAIVVATQKKETLRLERKTLKQIDELELNFIKTWDSFALLASSFTPGDQEKCEKALSSLFQTGTSPQTSQPLPKWEEALIRCFEIRRQYQRLISTTFSTPGIYRITRLSGEPLLFLDNEEAFHSKLTAMTTVVKRRP